MNFMNIALIKRLGLAALLVTGAAGAAEPDFLEPEQAFEMSARATGAKTVELRFTIADGYYLYKNKFVFSADAGAVLGTVSFPPAVVKDDAQFGRTETYRGTLVLPMSVQQAAGSVTVSAKAQGCADAGLCYSPFLRTASITLPAGVESPASTSTSTSTVPATSTAPQDESQRVGAMLQSSSLPLVLTSFFGFGLLLAFTPCVFPMIPILSGIIVGSGEQLTRRRGFVLSLAYVLGMAVTYTAAGVAAGLSGTLLSAALQNVWVLGSFALVFVLLSLSMFGFYELQLPASLQGRLTQSANQRGGSLTGVALMGALSALIVGPCVAAPLAGALLYIAQTGDTLLGGAALFTMALGMGAPLLVLGLTASSVLPRAGAWMHGVKRAFGVMLLGVALWLAQPVLPPLAVMLGWAALLLSSGIFLHALDPLPAQANGMRRFWKSAGVMMALVGAAQLVGAMAGSRDPLQPLAALRSASPIETAQSGVKFERVRSVAEFDARLAAADRPVMLDFYADWCISCREMEQLTFNDPAVKARLARLQLLQVDVTANSADDRALLKRYGLFGPPGILFFAPGSVKESRRVVGFQATTEFIRVLDSALREFGDEKPVAGQVSAADDHTGGSGRLSRHAAAAP